MMNWVRLWNTRIGRARAAAAESELTWGAPILEPPLSWGVVHAPTDDKKGIVPVLGGIVSYGWGVLRGRLLRFRGRAFVRFVPRHNLRLEGDLWREALPHDYR